MKAVIYYEGPCEREMLNHLFHQSYQPINLTDDYVEFLTTPNNQNAILFFDCEGYQNVFPYIADTPHYYGHDERIIIIRDLERTICFEALENCLFRDYPIVPQSRTKLIIAKSNFEHLYLADLDIFKRIFCLMYNEKFGMPIPDENEFNALINSLDRAKPHFKKIFKDYKMSFPKVEVADKFFGRFDFFNSDNPYFIRLVDSFSLLFCIDKSNNLNFI